MVTTSVSLKSSSHPLSHYIHQLESGHTLLPNSTQHVQEVVGVLHSYGIVLDAYCKNLIYIAENAFLEPFPFFKYFNGEITLKKILQYAQHDRINFEYAEYCMKAMLWHGSNSFDAYLDSPELAALAQQAITTKLHNNPLLQGFHRLFPAFFPEQIRQLCYYSALGQFWRIMSDLFMELSAGYDRGEIPSVRHVVNHICQGLVDAAATPITYTVRIRNQSYDIIPLSAGITFLMDVAVPYVEAVFLKGTPFFGTVSYNAQAHQISPNPAEFAYGALFADPLMTGAAGIPPTLLMQDMRHFLPNYLHKIYQRSPRGEDNLRVQICQSFQKSMFCVTNAAIQGLAPHSLCTSDPNEQQAVRAYLEGWMNRLLTSRLSQL
ncbi:MAG: CO2 hydration protein [Trichocoleus desertorum ATA4-8-CV12]|jgi:CO2 hydration protein|nr:CO2 hydration protein [Trichocoleus desertorum ATA4-8-CV12]